MTRRTHLALRLAAALVAGGAACTAHVAPVPDRAAAPPVEAPASQSLEAPAAPSVEAPASPPGEAPAPPANDRTVINFEEDTGGAMPSGPELDVVDSKPRAKFKSLIDPKYRRDGGAAAVELPSE